jgi:hypothetical protein
MFNNNLKFYIERLWEIIPKCQTHYYVYLDEYYVSLQKNYWRISIIFYPCGWNILFLCGKYLVYVAIIF